MSSKKLAFIIASTFLVSTTLPLVAVAKMQPIDHYQSAMYQLISACAMGVRRYCCSSPECTHSRFFCQKACSACGLKGTEQWIAQ